MLTTKSTILNKMLSLKKRNNDFLGSTFHLLGSTVSPEAKTDSLKTLFDYEETFISSSFIIILLIIDIC